MTCNPDPIKPRGICTYCPLSTPPMVEWLATHQSFVMGHDGQLLWYSPAWRFTGQPGEVLGHRWLEFFHPEDIPIFQNWLADGQNTQLRFRFFSRYFRRPEGWHAVVVHKERMSACCWLVVGSFEEN